MEMSGNWKKAEFRAECRKIHVLTVTSVNNENILTQANDLREKLVALFAFIADEVHRSTKIQSFQTWVSH